MNIAVYPRVSLLIRQLLITCTAIHPYIHPSSIDICPSIFTIFRRSACIICQPSIMSYNKVSPILNTLSSARPRQLPTNFGELTLNAVKRDAARGLKHPNPNVRKQYLPNETSELLNSLASRPPGKALDSQPSPMRSSRLGQSQSRSGIPRPKPSTESIEKRLNDTRVRFSVPDPRKPTSSPAPQSEYIRPVARLDALAAKTGIDSSASSVAPRRTYKDRFAARSPSEQQQQQQPTRFALPRSPTGGRGRAGARKPGLRTAAPGQTRERRQTKAQEAESARKAAIAERQAAPPPKPVDYSFSGIDISEFAPVLQKLYANGAKSTYLEHKALSQDQRDAARLVVGNRSIVRKQTVLKKIETWIPEEKGRSGEARA